ncbi:hypothetical protein FOL46_000241 [Perkinsus olseni]|uniref:C2H2-type domain-containing protein n=1 Tax=Perkinsus olseni TaxID=32597 RepID=A0A7J6MK39_PEROL|nr:hypothetical protein FOL46_000241 [Perkinsus olseni]
MATLRLRGSDILGLLSGPLGYFFCLQCSVSFQKLSHIQVHWDTCDCHENGNGSRDVRAPPLQPLKAADLVVKSEVVDGEVDYTQPDEDQCSLVDLCSSDEEIDGGGSNDYVSSRLRINPSPLPIPARRRNQAELDKVRSDASDDCTRQATLQIGNVKVRAKASSSSSSPEGTYKIASSAAMCRSTDPKSPLPRVPKDWNEKDPRFACEDCIRRKRNDGWTCTLCEMDLWSPGEVTLHETTKRHQKGVGYKIWENIEVFIKRRHSNDLRQLGVIETAANTLLCTMCDVPLQSYYDAASHVNSIKHFEYSQHYAWWLDARAVFTGENTTGVDRQWRAVATYLLKDMPDPKRLIDEEGIIPVKDCDSLCGDGSYLLAVTKRTTNEALVLWRGGHMHTSQPYERSSATLPKVPMNFSEADERFACKDCFMQRGDNNFVCLLCDMEFWGEADLRFHSSTRRHQKASRNKVWENMETFIQMRYGDSLSQLGVVKTAAGTSRCVHCEKPLPSYYDAARHVNSRAHDDYMKHAFWYCEAQAIHDGMGWR